MMATTGVVYPTIIGFDKLILIALSMNKFMKMKSKIQYYFLAGMMLLGGVLATSGCQKENDREGIPEGAVLITAEGFGGMEGDKTSVSAESVVWENGDRVSLNGDDYTVTVSGSKAYVSGFSSPDGPFRGIYPAGLTAGTQTVTVPSQYESHYNNGRQVLHLPMLAMAGARADAIRFRHATAAVRVLVKNSLNVDVVVTGVSVSSEGGQLCGTRGVTLGVGTLAVAAQSEDDAIADEDKQVSVLLTDSPLLAHGGSDIIEVQVPILPVAEGDMTITVYAHMAGAAPGARNFTFTHTASHPELARNVMMTARVNLSTDGGRTTEDTKGRFSVGENRWVVFAHGNLQYNAGTSTFRFAPEQYDIIGDGNSHVASSYSGWIDLMGWGTSGYQGSNPWLSSTNVTDYGPTTGDIATTQYDWGVHNAIEKAGAAGTWRTLTSSEWDYLLNDRSAVKRFAKVALSVDGTTVNGLVLFPDDYNVADGLRYNQTNLGYEGQGGSNILSLSQWRQMEAEGAVFLPAAGYRAGTSPTEVGGTGYYWSSSRVVGSAQALRFADENLVFDSSPAVYYGNAVRLCSDI